MTLIITFAQLTLFASNTVLICSVKQEWVTAQNCLVTKHSLLKDVMLLSSIIRKEYCIFKNLAKRAQIITYKLKNVNFKITHWFKLIHNKTLMY